jgi:CHAT domain-containing protein/Tfp pilus assembly protein PilF
MKYLILLLFCSFFVILNTTVYSQSERWAELMDKVQDLNRLNRIDEAIDTMKLTVHIAENTFGKIDTNTAISLERLGFLYHKKGNFKEAKTLYKTALDIQIKILGEFDHEVAASLNNLAELYQNQGFYAESDSLYRRSLLIREKIYGKMDINIANSLNSLARLKMSLALYSDAEPLLIESLEIKKEVLDENDPEIAISLINLAALYRSQGKYSKSEPLYYQAISIFKEAGSEDHSDYAMVLNNLAALYYNEGRYSEAEPLYKKSLSIREKIYGKDHLFVATALNNLAALYRKQGRFLQAEELYNNSINIYKKMLGIDHPDYAMALSNLAGVYLDENRFKEAEPLYKKALNIRKKRLGENHPEVAFSLNSLAELYRGKKQYSKAEPLYKEALKLRESALGTEHPYYAASLTNLGVLYLDEKRYNDAESILLKSLDIRLRTLGNEHPDLANSFFNLARLYKGKKDFQKAEYYYKKGNQNLLNQIDLFFPSMSELEKEQFYNTLKNKFEFFNLFVLKTMYENPVILNDMLDMQLATKALILNSTNKVKRRILGSNDETLKNKYRKWIETKEYINKSCSLTKEEIIKRKINIDSLEKDANETEKELSSKSEVFAREYDKKRITFGDIYSKLKDNEAAIEIIRLNYYDEKPSDSILYVFLIITKETKEHPEIVFFKQNKKSEERYLQDYLGMLQLNDRGSFERYFQKVSDFLHNSKNKITNVYISPDGVYNKINISSLKKPDGSYVIDDFDIHYLGNLKDIVETGFSSIQNADQLNSAELFGNPTFNSDENKIVPIFRSGSMQPLILNSLPGTKEEVEDIAGLLTKENWKVKTYLANNALESKIKALINPRVLHIATHGFFIQDPENGSRKQTSTETDGISENPLLKSGLFLSEIRNNLNDTGKENIEKDDGILTAYEAMNLNLDSTEIVVLSACQSGLGTVKNGEGVYGLQRSFQVAGAKNIMMSLWNVSDEATRELMTVFYGYWVKSHNKREAFREAQKTLRNKYNSPFYWGAFILIGD